MKSEKKPFLKSQSSSEPLCSIVFVNCLWLESDLLGDKKSGNRSSSVWTAVYEKPECWLKEESYTQSSASTDDIISDTACQK